MNTVSMSIGDGKEFSASESDSLSVQEASEMSRGAWRGVIVALVLEALFLASLGAWLFSSLHRFQDCL